MAQVKFQATQRHVNLHPTGTSASWGGVNVQADAVVWFATTSLSKRLLVYFLRPASPDPGPQYNPDVHTGALFLPLGEFPKWANLVYSGRSVYVFLETGARHGHYISTYNW